MTTGPGGCELGMRRSTSSGGGSLAPVPSSDRREYAPPPADEPFSSRLAGACWMQVQDLPLRPSAKEYGPSSELGVIKLTRAGGGKSESGGG